MPSFADNLKTFAPITAIDRLELRDAAGELVATIENRPGQQGSLALYNHLRERFGRIDQAAAHEGLALYAEHTPDARANPCRHPNIDRLLAIVQGAAPLEATPVPRAS
ncbi:MAG: DUF2322 family protein [Burkholderiales bacterium]|nr:DUF2322 family protein [Burkholderiales bacterium]